MTAFDLKVEDDGLAILTFDLPGEKVNKLSTEVIAELGDLLVRLAREARIRGLLIRSGKPDVFIAGADVKEFTRVKPEDARTAVERVQALFEQLANLPYPTVAAIDGACLGGGTELALACDYRLMSDSKKAQIGLPEVRLGIFPAWGGCTRLPRVVGLPAALDLILTGKSLDGRRGEEDRPRRRGRSGGDLRRLGPAFRPGEARGKKADLAPRAASLPAAPPGAGAAGAQADLHEGPRGRDQADRRPLPGAARGPRGHRGGIREAGRGGARGRGAPHRVRVRWRSPAQSSRHLLPDRGGQEGDGGLGPGRAPARGDAGRRPRGRRHGRRHRAARGRQGPAGADEGHRGLGAGPRVRRRGRRLARGLEEAADDAARDGPEDGPSLRNARLLGLPRAARSRSRRSSRSSRSSAPS